MATEPAVPYGRKTQCPTTAKGSAAKATGPAWAPRGTEAGSIEQGIFAKEYRSPNCIVFFRQAREQTVI
jgi:hypothetical protein